ncbi:uncharacterized protein LOC143452723 isoform X2 [Clavelina lepadiformis]|uniref:uncharacterized protein LOC143452723 isoform X2 n=1 Tax=Clavelina lepadiformis TaxID=159417 RepID=UPI00404190CE
MCHVRLLGKRTSLLCMLGMTSSFFLAEIIVGYLTNSTALIADSFHMLSDVLSIIIGFLAVVYSKKDSKINTYGWARAEVVGALSNAVFLLALCFSIVMDAIQRLVVIEPIDQPLLVIIVGSVGLLINLIGLVLFHGHSHGHDHSHDHGHDHGHQHNHDHSKQCKISLANIYRFFRITIKLVSFLIAESNDSDNRDVEKVKQHGGSQLNMKGVFLHVLGDALGSVVVIISALIIYFVEEDWRYYADPVMTLVIAGIIMYTTIPLLKQSAMILLQTPPPHIKKDELMAKVKQIEGVLSIHELHVWQLSGNCTIASAHVTMHGQDDFVETAKKLNQVFHDIGVHSVTLQPEVYDCEEGKWKCGVRSCPYASKSGTGALQQANEIILSLYDDSCTSSAGNAQNGNQTCLLSCVSELCQEYQCCTSNSNGQPKLNTKSKNLSGNVNNIEAGVINDIITS